MTPNRRSEISSADAAASFDGMDAIAEPTRKYLRRLAEVSAHPPLEAFDKHEGMTFYKLSQQQMS